MFLSASPPQKKMPPYSSGMDIVRVLARSGDGIRQWLAWLGRDSRNWSARVESVVVVPERARVVLTLICLSR